MIACTLVTPRFGTDFPIGTVEEGNARAVLAVNKLVIDIQEALYI